MSIDDYLRKYINTDIDTDIFDPCLDEFFSNYNNLSKIKYQEYLLESNPNISDYLIIIINNCSSNGGLSDFIKNQMFMNSLNIKIYLYKNNSLEYIIGPININSFEKICFITNYIVYFINRDCRKTLKSTMENEIQEYFKNDKNNKILFYN